MSHILMGIGEFKFLPGITTETHGIMDTDDNGEMLQLPDIKQLEEFLIKQMDELGIGFQGRGK